MPPSIKRGECMLIEMNPILSPYIDGVPNGKKSAWQAATRCDEVTVNSLEKKWIKNSLANSKAYDIAKNSVMNLYPANLGRPVILAGSGPSLQKNIEGLKGNGKELIGRKNIPIVSASHNFRFLEENDIMTPDDYYVVLDSCDITIDHIQEGKNPPEWYWERSAERTLIASNVVDPRLISMWRGKVYWFTTPYSTENMAKEISAQIDTSVVPGFNVGGNVMGASLYFAKSILGSSIPVFIGMDLSFSYSHKFYPDSEGPGFETTAGLMPWIDIFGNRVFTQPSYFGFKSWFDYIACGGQGNNQQMWINATEGGILGAYPEGNIVQIRQMSLRDTLNMLNISFLMPEMLQKSINGNMHLLF